MKKLIASLVLGTALTLGALSAGAAEPSTAVLLTPDDNGGAAVSIELPDSEGITSMRLRLQVQTTLGEADAAAATFDFDDALPGRVQQSRYNRETGTLTLYVSGRDPLFTDGTLSLGTVRLTSSEEAGATASVTVEEDCLRILNASYGGEKTPDPDLPADPVEITVGDGGRTPDPAVDKTRLEAALELARAKQQADYTTESWVRFRQVLSYAERVYGSVDATQQELDEALTQLNAAMEQLAPVESVPDATPDPEQTPKPSATPKPTQTPGATQKPTASPAPSASPAPTAAPSQTPAATPNSGSGSVEVTTPTQAPQNDSGSNSGSGSQQQSAAVPNATQAPTTSVIGSVKSWLTGKKPTPTATPSATSQPTASPAPTQSPDAATVETAGNPSPSPEAAIDATQAEVETPQKGISPVIWAAIAVVVVALVGVAVFLIRRQS